ncbi:MAG: low molecular weight phosphatase family protein [Pseudomonadota bacterium]
MSEADAIPKEADGAADEAPRAVLFACNLNSVRSPMAEAIAKAVMGADAAIDSVGVYEGFADPFAAAVMAEAGYDLSAHAPKTFADVADARFDLIIALTPEAYRRAKELADRTGGRAEYWPIANPSEAHGSRDQIMDSYRQTRDDLVRSIDQRFRTD